MREYQENFINIYDNFKDSSNRLRKAGKFNYILKKLGVHDPEGTCLDTGCSNGIITNSLSPLFKYTYSFYLRSKL